MTGEELQTFTASAETIGLRGRVMASTYQRHFLIDATSKRDGLEPECPNAGQIFLSSLSGCAAVILNSEASNRAISPFHAKVTTTAGRRPSAPNKFVHIDMEFELTGVSQELAEELVKVFQDQCPIYDVAVAGLGVSVKVRAKHG